VNWSIAIADVSAEAFRSELESAFLAAYGDAPEPVKQQFHELADGAERLVLGHVGEAPFSATLQGYVSEPGGESTSNSVGFSIIGNVPGE
jgi:hypothetical protein